MSPQSKSPGVHIQPTTKGVGEGSDTGGNRQWALEGFDLKAALSRVFGEDERLFPESRIELPPSFDPRRRYDFVLVLASHETYQDRRHLMRSGIEAYFGVTIAHESQLTEVYVLSVVPGGHPAITQSAEFDGGGGIGMSNVSFAVPNVANEPLTSESLQGRLPTWESWRQTMASSAITGISVSNGSMSEFCDLLEEGLDRPVVDETGLTGHYDIDLPSRDPGGTDLAQRLRTELGLALTTSQREVTRLVVRRSSAVDGG